MRWAMVALVGSLAGCGGGPAAAPPGLSAPLLRGGAWRAGCVAGPVAWAARDGAVERWRFGPDGPAQEAVIPLGGAPRATRGAHDRAPRAPRGVPRLRSAADAAPGARRRLGAMR